MIADIPKKILLVEDDAVDAQLVQRILGEWSDEIAVKVVTMVYQAIAAVAEETYDCVLLDFDLPDQPGLEFLQHCRTAQGHQPWPVVMLSGSSKAEQIVGAIKLGAKDYLLKDKLHETKMLQSRMIMAMSEWGIETQKSQFDNSLESHIYPRGSEQKPNHDALLQEIRSIRAKYYGLLDKYNQSVLRGFESAGLNANLVAKIMEYERLIRRLSGGARSPDGDEP